MRLRHAARAFLQVIVPDHPRRVQRLFQITGFKQTID
jgi:hypothetical protein